MNSVTNRPVEYMSQKRYLGSYFADDFLINSNYPRTFIKGQLISFPAREYPYFSTLNRIYQSFDVLRGKADAIYWQESFTNN